MFVLFVDHNPERQRAVGEVLATSGHRVETATSGEAALIRMAGPSPPRLVVVEDRLPDMEIDAFLQALGRMDTGCHVIVYGEQEAPRGWIAATRSGLQDYLTIRRDGSWLEGLPAYLDEAIARAGEAARARSLAAALDSTGAAVLLLDRRGRVRYANDAGRRLLGRTTAELEEEELGRLLLFADDVQARSAAFRALETDGEWAGEVHVRRPGGEEVPAIVTLSPVRQPGRRGSDGFVLTLRDVSERVAMEEALRQANRRLAEQAARDPLTGLYNRRYFREVLDREGARNCRYKDPLTVLMSDLDGFKEVNDRLGHDQGDRLLTDVARALPEELREGDVVARLGGDEFCVLLPNTSEASALVVARRLLEGVRRLGEAWGGEVAVEMSLGLATSPAHADGPCLSPGELLRRADMALLAAKRAGGDRIIAYSSFGDAARPGRGSGPA